MYIYFVSQNSDRVLDVNFLHGFIKSSYFLGRTLSRMYYIIL